MAYAEGTTVPVDRSLAEINKILKKAGAERIAQYEEPGKLAIQCFLFDRLLRFHVILPTPDTIETKRGSRTAIADLVARGCRQRARALLLVIKAKLESVESGVESFDEAFLANVVMPDGKTVADHTLEPIRQSYISGNAPTQLLLAAQ